MCKTCFDSQGMVLNVFFFLQKNFVEKKTLITHETLPPFMANAIKNFHFL